MMSGYNLYRSFQRTEQEANLLGFKFAHSKYSREEDVIGLFPKDDCMPDYARDAELFCGSLQRIEGFIRGIEFANRYYSMLKLVSDKKIEDKEQITRNRQLMHLMKTGVKDEGIEK
jgi:hypothetical protein